MGEDGAIQKQGLVRSLGVTENRPLRSTVKLSSFSSSSSSFLGNEMSVFARPSPKLLAIMILCPKATQPTLKTVSPS